MNSTVDTPLYSTGRHVALRLKPGEEVLGTLQQFVVDHGIAACAIVSSVGSLTHAAIRYANQNDTTRLEGHFEIRNANTYVVEPSPSFLDEACDG